MSLSLTSDAYRQKLYEEASNPEQYQHPQWLKMGDENNPIRRFLKRVIDEQNLQLERTKILDVGCGTGWLVNHFHQQGAEAVGIDISAKNIEYAKRNYPEPKFFQSSLAEYSTHESYNLITGILSFSHIPDIKSASKRCRTVLKDNGKVMLLIQDFHYNFMPRHDYEVKIDEISKDEFVTTVRRSGFAITDIIRKNSLYVSSFEDFSLESETSLTPDNQLIEDLPKYSEFVNTAIFQLLTFSLRP